MSPSRNIRAIPGGRCRRA